MLCMWCMWCVCDVCDTVWLWSALPAPPKHVLGHPCADCSSLVVAAGFCIHSTCDMSGPKQKGSQEPTCNVTAEASTTVPRHSFCMLMSLIVTNSHLVTAFLNFWRTLDSWWFPSCCKALSDHNRPQPTPQFQCARSRLPFASDWIYRKREWIWEKLRNEMAWMKHNETFRIVALVAEHFGI
jgi:hypothetical protein